MGIPYSIDWSELNMPKVKVGKGFKHFLYTDKGKKAAKKFAKKVGSKVKMAKGY